MPAVAPRSLRHWLTRRRTGWIGIDVGTAAVKLAQVKLHAGRWQLIETAIVNLSSPRPLTLESVAEDWIAESVLRGLKQGRSFQGKAAACVLSPAALEMRTLEIPRGTEAERRDMVGQELAANLGRSIEDFEFDFWESGQQPGEAASEISLVNTAAASRELVNRVAAQLLSAGLTCQVVDGTPFTLARAQRMNRTSSSTEHPVAILDWGFSAATFTVVSRNQPVFTRPLRDCAFQRLLKVVADGLGLPPEDCREALATYGIPSQHSASSGLRDLQQVIIDFAGDPLNFLMDELHKTLAFLKLQWPGHVPESLCIVGGGAVIRNLSSHVSANLELPVEIWCLDGEGNANHGGPQALFANAAALSALGCRS